MQFTNIEESHDILANGRPFINVLDKGFVELVEINPRVADKSKPLGIESIITDAARTSYLTADKPKLSTDRGLLRYLMRNEHWTPYEMANLTFRIRLPLFVHAQMVRHRTAKQNVQSARYSVMPDLFYVPERVRKQSDTNKQGSSDEFVDDETADLFYSALEKQIDIYSTYTKLIEKGVTKELARILLPQNLYTECYWQSDLRNLFNFMKLRLDKHAQYEIRQYAEAIYQITKKYFPQSVSAFDDYILNSLTLTSPELKGEIKGREAREFENKKIYMKEFVNGEETSELFSK